MIGLPPLNGFSRTRNIVGLIALIGLANVVGNRPGQTIHTLWSVERDNRDTGVDLVQHLGNVAHHP
jgi:hypothetical protein